MDEKPPVPESGDFIVWNDIYDEIITVTADRDGVLPLFFYNVICSNVRPYPRSDSDKRTIKTQYRIYQNGSVHLVNNGSSLPSTAKFMKREEAALHKLGNVYDAAN